MLVTLVCPDMKFVEVCGISAKNLVDYQQLLRPLNRTLVGLKGARVSSEKQKQALFVKCIPVSLMSNVKRLFNLIISFSLLYLVLCSIPHFHIISYMLLVIYLINQFP